MKNTTRIYFVLFFISGCITKEQKHFIKHYYPSGKISSYGWYTKDSIPLDTIWKFYENGKLSAKDVYDSKGTGKLDGTSILFFENGNKYQVSNYDKGITQGYLFEFNENGKLRTKQFYLNDKPFGDHYSYNENELVKEYAFFLDEINFVNYIEYDSIGRIKNEPKPRSLLFNYISMIKRDTSNKIIKKYCEIKLVTSNPLHSSIKINVDFISKNGFFIKRDSIYNAPFYSSSYLMPDSLKIIKYSAIQYDSIMQKYFYSKFETAH